MAASTCGELGPYSNIKKTYKWLTIIQGMISLILLVLSLVGTLIYDDVGMPSYVGGYITGVLTACQAGACSNIAREAKKEDENARGSLSKWMKFQYIVSLANVFGGFVSLIIISIASGRYDDNDSEDTRHYGHNKRITHTLLVFCMMAMISTLFAMILVCVVGPKYGVHVVNKEARIAAARPDPRETRTSTSQPQVVLFQVPVSHPSNWNNQPTRRTLPPLNAGNQLEHNNGNQYDGGRSAGANAVYDLSERNRRERNQNIPLPSNMRQNQSSVNQTDAFGNVYNQSASGAGTQPRISVPGNSTGNQHEYEAPPSYSQIFPNAQPLPSAPPPPYQPF